MTGPIEHSVLSSKILDVLFSDTKSLLILTDDSLRIIKTSLSARLFFGENADSLPGRTILRLLGPESIDTVHKIRKSLTIDGEAVWTHLSIVDYLGDLVSFSTTIRYVVCDECDRRVLLFFMRDPEKRDPPPFQDVDAEYTLRRFLTGNADSVMLIDFKKRAIIECNSASEKMFGYERSEIIGRSPQFLSADQEEAINQARKSFVSYARTGYYQDQIVCRRKDGTFFPTLATNFAIYNENKELRYILAINRDITATISRKQALGQIARETGELAKRMKEITDQLSIGLKSRTFSDLGFSKKQIVIAGKLLSGVPIKSIAMDFSVSESGIKNHLAHIYRLTGVASRVEFMKFVQDHQIRFE